MAILGQLIASVNISTTVSTAAQWTPEVLHWLHTHQGKPVCSQVFRFLHGIGNKRQKNLARNMKENGLSPRVLGNVKRKPKHALSFTSIEYVGWFLFSYAEQHALLLQGRVPGYSRSDLQLLPSSTLKRAASSSDHERQCASSLLTVTLVHEYPGRGMQPGHGSIVSSGEEIASGTMRHQVVLIQARLIGRGKTHTRACTVSTIKYAIPDTTIHSINEQVLKTIFCRFFRAIITCMGRPVYGMEPARSQELLSQPRPQELLSQPRPQELLSQPRPQKHLSQCCPQELPSQPWASPAQAARDRRTSRTSWR